MPSWPSRLLLGSSAPSTPSQALDSPAVQSPSQKFTDFGAPQQEAYLYGVPILQPSASLGSSSTSIPIREGTRHGRSFSHPFPSLFGSGRRSDRRPEGNINTADLDSLDDQAFRAFPVTSVNDSKTQSSRATPHYGEKDHVTGKCSTCDSVVRWPKHINVFRCTVCLMINDLNPVPREIPVEDACGRKSPIEAAKDSGLLREAPHLSLERTKALIDECLLLYLRSLFGCLRADESNASHGDVAQIRGNAIEGDYNAPIISVATGIRHDKLDYALQETGHGLEPSTFSLPTSPNVNNLGSSVLRGRVTNNAGPPPSRAPPPPPKVDEDTLELSTSEATQQIRLNRAKSIFRSLEKYVSTCFSSFESINGSFSIRRPPRAARAVSEGAPTSATMKTKLDDWNDHETPLSELDAKTLLLGDFAENGMWWTGRARVECTQSQRVSAMRSDSTDASGNRVGFKTPRIHWGELNEWYHTILSAGRSWKTVLKDLQANCPDIEGRYGYDFTNHQQQIEEDIAGACMHLQRTLLKACENLLRRPGRPLRNPEDSRFLFILLANPLLYPPGPSQATSSSPVKTQSYTSRDQKVNLPPSATTSQQRVVSRKPPVMKASLAGQHSGILKRIFGLMSNLPNECHHHLIAWISRFSETQFRRIVDLVGSFVTYRLTRQHGRERRSNRASTNGLVPNVSGPGAGSSAQLHAALGTIGTMKPSETYDSTVEYSEDWQIKAAARVMSLLFSANSNSLFRKQDATRAASPELAIAFAARQRTHTHGLVLPISTFYNTLLDYSDLIADFEAWESRRTKFSFCQYPMFLSIWAKIHIMEHDARRQMEIKAREAFFNSIMSRKAVSQYLVLKVRRDCLVEDSLRGVSEVVGTGDEDIKKGLRIEFIGEEGVDAGGLRKEWFSLLVREVFDPEHGLFIYDEDSHCCYFNPNSFETSDQFFLVGVLLGLAIYNSTILDVALPPFAFRKLLASAPNYTGPITTSLRPTINYTLEDLAEFRPALAKGLVQLLEYDGDVEETFCRDFVAGIDRYGHVTSAPLCPNGENRPVTNKNRREFVELYTQYLLDIAVSRQFEPFKRGFFTVCGGNALSLFRPEEIELLVRGSDELLDVASLQAVSIYENWGKGVHAETEPLVMWFWDIFANADVKEQRKILSFITASDRIPAMGATSLVIKVVCLGEDSDRFPTARTCFNMLGLYKYQSKKKLEVKLWRAILESEGFGLR